MMQPCRERSVTRQGFLTLHGWGSAQHFPIPGDASFRSYIRLKRGQESIILMDAPPHQEDTRPFIAIALELRRRKLSAPEIIAHDVENGFLLLEDLGTDSFTLLLRRAPHQEMELYERAVDVLATIAAEPPVSQLRDLDGGKYIIMPYDHLPLTREARLMVDWFFKAAKNRLATNEEIESYIAAWQPAFDIVTQQTQHAPVLVLRDFHVDNMMWLPERPGQSAVGLLDFQDALIGHAAYDLVSLTQDARRDIDESLEKHLLEQFLRGFACDDLTAFHNVYAILGAQRAAKIIGIFTRLAMRDGKSSYLSHIPRVWNYLERDLETPVLAEVRQWFDDHLPPDLRDIPPGLTKP